jgi:hypothetical protein
MTRRDALRIGCGGAFGLSLAGYLRAAEAGGVHDARATSALFIYRGGGPSHLDTFDMKPDAADDIRGEFRPIDTNVPGLKVCELLPKLARCADRYAVLRGVAHNIAGHELGTAYLNTGNRPIPSLEFPGYGAVVSKELAGSPDLPHFVAVPKTPQRAGYLGERHAPLETAAAPKLGQPFSVRGIALEDGLTVEQFAKRQRLLDRVDTAFAELEEASALVDGLDRFDRQAFPVIGSPKAREAFDTSREPADVAAAFGEHNFGQSCLLAVRLIEAGVRFVTVTFSGWDTHSGNFRKSRESLLPQLDDGLSALLTNLEARGLLDTTAVFVTGEFGRTPKVNAQAGRDHWPRAFSALMAGGGIAGGRVHGASDATGSEPAGEPITPENMAATFYHALGIDHRREYHTHTGRPVMIVREGSVMGELFA